MYDYNKLILRRLKKEKGILVTTIYNKEKKYHLHTIKVYSRNNKNELITTYQLIGEKGKKIYRFAIYNADEAFKEKINDFLVETFNNN
jgi:3-oxoacyl-[acyl-carrier-protein] synthase III